jgi:hypothetical protein
VFEKKVHTEFISGSGHFHGRLFTVLQGYESDDFEKKISRALYYYEKGDYSKSGALL